MLPIVLNSHGSWPTLLPVPIILSLLFPCNILHRKSIFNRSKKFILTRGHSLDFFFLFFGNGQMSMPNVYPISKQINFSYHLIPVGGRTHFLLKICSRVCMVGSTYFLALILCLCLAGAYGHVWTPMRRLHMGFGETSDTFTDCKLLLNRCPSSSAFSHLPQLDQYPCFTILALSHLF